MGYPTRQTSGHRGEDTVVERLPVKKGLNLLTSLWYLFSNTTQEL